MKGSICLKLPPHSVKRVTVFGSKEQEDNTDLHVCFIALQPSSALCSCFEERKLGVSLLALASANPVTSFGLMREGVLVMCSNQKEFGEFA